MGSPAPTGLIHEYHPVAASPSHLGTADTHIESDALQSTAPWPGDPQRSASACPSREAVSCFSNHVQGLQSADQRDVPKAERGSRARIPARGSTFWRPSGTPRSGLDDWEGGAHTSGMPMSRLGASVPPSTSRTLPVTWEPAAA